MSAEGKGQNAQVFYTRLEPVPAWMPMRTLDCWRHWRGRWRSASVLGSADHKPVIAVTEDSFSIDADDGSARIAGGEHGDRDGSVDALYVEPLRVKLQPMREPATP